MQLFIVSLI